jgi:hypothetical protein
MSQDAEMFLKALALYQASRTAIKLYLRQDAL